MIQRINRLTLLVTFTAVVLYLIQVTLITDIIATVVRTIPESTWGYVLLLERTLMVILTSTCIILLIAVHNRTQSVSSAGDLTPADGIDDLWTLVRFPVMKAHAYLPRSFVGWVQRISSERLFARFQRLNLRTHSWRFACALGLLSGIGLTYVQWQEGLPPNLKVGLLVAGLFISAEFMATLLGFAILVVISGCVRPSKKGVM